MPGKQHTASDIPATGERDVVISMRGVRTVFGSRVIHDGVDLDVYRGEVLALVGGSGSGKSTLMREMIMLHVPDGGSVKLFGTELVGIGEDEANALRRRLGVLFQESGDLSRARQELEAARDANPKYILGRITLGVLFLSLGENELAHHIIGQALLRV